jgi:hypothetical protein
MDRHLTRLLGCRTEVDFILTGNFVVRHNSIRAFTGVGLPLLIVCGVSQCTWIEIRPRLESERYNTH